MDTSLLYSVYMSDPVAVNPAWSIYTRAFGTWSKPTIVPCAGPLRGWADTPLPRCLCAHTRTLSPAKGGCFSGRKVSSARWLPLALSRPYADPDLQRFWIVGGLWLLSPLRSPLCLIAVGLWSVHLSFVSGTLQNFNVQEGLSGSGSKKKHALTCPGSQKPRSSYEVLTMWDIDPHDHLRSSVLKPQWE